MSAARIVCLAAALAARAAVGADSDGSPRTPEAGKEARTIEIRPERPVFALGGPIELRVVYTNRTDRAWKLERPETSDSVKVTYQPAGRGDRHRVRFSLSRKTTHEVKLPGGKTQLVQVIPPRAPVEIAPGGKREFTVDLDRGWTEDLAPGKFEAWVEDAEAGLKSNTCSFALVFSRDSVAPLLAAAAREEESPARRAWCQAWLRRIDPGFTLKLPEAKGSPEDLRRIAEENAAAIRAFRELWKRIEGSPETEASFRKADRNP